MVGAHGSGRRWAVDGQGYVMRLALCAVEGLLAGLAVRECAAVLAWRAFVSETETAFVLGGRARRAIWGHRMAEVGSLLLSLKCDAFLWGHLSVAEGVHGWLKWHAHGRVLRLVWRCRDVLHLLDRHWDVVYWLCVVHWLYVDADSGHVSDVDGLVERGALLLLEELCGGEREGLRWDLVCGMWSDELGR